MFKFVRWYNSKVTFPAVIKEQEKSPTYKQGFFIMQYYSSEIAPVGQVPAQEPQEMQAVASISNLPSPSEIAPTGQEPAQAPQDTQLSPITNAIIIILLLLSELYCLLVKYLNKYILKQVYIDSKFFL